MQILYAFDTNKDGMIEGKFDVATSTTNWANVAAVRIVLTFRSNARVEAPKPGDPAEGYLLKTVTSTISLRNRAVL